LVDDLQELSRAEARQIPLVIRPTDPTQIAATALDRLSGSFEEKGLELRTEVPPRLPLIKADPDRAVQVLSSLLTNALRYTAAPGCVELKVGVTNGMVEFMVHDSGIGISDESLSQVFERFYRVDRSRGRALGGSGIGLTIAKALVQGMGGRIRAESAGAGQGSTIAFTLPVA
jgi:two-component system, OmpR family, sensor histidine kinase BaeS